MCDEKIKRIDWIDIVKAFAIICVIWGHVVDSDTKIKTLLYAFHMPLFFMLSGMVTQEKSSYKREMWKKFVQKKIDTLILPYLLWAFIYASLTVENIIYILWGTRETLLMADSLSSLWFLPVLFLASLFMEMILSVVSKLKYKRMGLILSGASSFIAGMLLPHNTSYGMVWGFDISLVALAFMIFGHLLLPVLKEVAHQKMWKLCAVLTVVGGTFLKCASEGQPDLGYVLMANAEYGNIIWFVANAVLGSLFVTGMALLVFKCGKTSGILKWIGKNTLGIFVIHKPVAQAGRHILQYAGLDYNNAVISLAVSIVVLVCSGLGVWFINNYIPVLFGKRIK